MMGLSVAQSALDAIGLWGLILGFLWTIAVLGASLSKRSRIAAVDGWLIALSIGCCSAWRVPEEQWRLLILRCHSAQQLPGTWLVSAAGSGQIRLMHYLIEKGADVNTRARYGQTALGAAAAGGQTDAVKLLIAHGARVENRTRVSLQTPLTEAAQMNHTSTVQLLLDFGADADARDFAGLTALDWARKNDNAELKKFSNSKKCDDANALDFVCRGK